MLKRVAVWLALWMAFACLTALPAGAEPQKMDPSVWLARFETYATQFELKEEYIPEQWNYRIPRAIMTKHYTSVSVGLFGVNPMSWSMCLCHKSIPQTKLAKMLSQKIWKICW